MPKISFQKAGRLTSDTLGHRTSAREFLQVFLATVPVILVCVAKLFSELVFTPKKVEGPSRGSSYFTCRRPQT